MTPLCFAKRRPNLCKTAGELQVCPTYSHDAAVGVLCRGQAVVKNGQGIYQLNTKLGEQ
jgi:hypothetical protein